MGERLTIRHAVLLHIIQSIGTSNLLPEIERELGLLLAVHRLPLDGLQIPDRAVDELEQPVDGALVGRQQLVEPGRRRPPGHLFGKDADYGVHDHDLVRQRRHVRGEARVEQRGVGDVVRRGVVDAFAEDAADCLEGVC